VYEDPEDKISREALMLAATQAGLAFSNASVALVHGMSRPLGEHFKVPHGLSNAMLLPVVTKFSVPAAQKRYADCARITGFATEAQSDAEACESLVKGLIQINKDMEVPTPADYGIDQDKYMGLASLMAEQALASGSPGNNPRAPSSDEIIELYMEAYRDSQFA
jgi:alcohol dehydrogenase